MPSQAWKATDILGLTPALDLRRAEGVFVLGGKNFAFDSLGPKSCFGNRILSTSQEIVAPYFQGVRIQLRGGDRVFYFSDTNMLEWDEASQTYTVLYAYSSLQTLPYRITAGYLNGKIYFCHPVFSLIVLDVESEQVLPHDGPGVPENPLAICIDNGRLIVIDENAEYWSEQSNGMNFTPTLGGAGFQLISDRVAGTPIMCHSYSRGVLVWTTGGVMRSEFAGDAEVYRHRNINTEYRPINSFCTGQLDDNTVIILDERGLFQSQGESPKPMTALFNEFLSDHIKKNKLTTGQNIRLEWDNLRRFLYVSVSVTEINDWYDKAFVLYPALDKWGSFDEPHFGIVPIRINGTQRAGDYFGFHSTETSFTHFWTQVASRQDSEDTTLPLDSYIQIGLIRFQGLNDSIDQLAEINQIMIGSAISGPNILTEDFNFTPDGQDEDWNEISGSEDLGLDRLNYVNHKIRLIGTVDGSTPFVEQAPSIVTFTKGTRHYSCTVPGIWHILELKADAVGETYHLRAFEFTGVYAGTL